MLSRQYYRADETLKTIKVLREEKNWPVLDDLIVTFDMGGMLNLAIEDLFRSIGRDRMHLSNYSKACMRARIFIAKRDGPDRADSIFGHVPLLVRMWL